MKRFFLTYLAFFILLSAVVAGEQNLSFRQISTQDGLSQNTVRSILVDRRGFVWAGTLDGLNRYDGKHFITYKPQPGNSRSISDHRIQHIREDAYGYLWVRKYDNTFSCYDPEQESFIAFQYNGQPVSLNYTGYLETRDSAVWLWGTANGCLRFRKDRQQKPYIDFYAPASSIRLTHSAVNFMFEDSQSTIWAGCASGLNRITPDLSVEQFFGGNHKQNFRKALEHEGKIYFITANTGIYTYHLQQRRFSDPVHLPEHTFLNAVLLNDGRILLVTREKGLLVFNPGNRKFEKSPFPSKLQGNTQLLTDRKGGVWAFNHTGILWHYEPTSGQIRELPLIPPHIASVIDFERYHILIDSQGLYWITTYGNGLFCYHPSTGELNHYSYSAKTNSPASDYLLTITEDQSSNLWIGSEYAGIIKVVRQNYGTRFLYPESEISIGKSNNVKAVFEDSGQNIWIGTKNGSLYRYDANLQNKKCIAHNLNPYTITEDHRQRIWVGTKGNGIYIFDRNTAREIAHLRHSAGAPHSLSHNDVFTILCDRDRRIWVGTFGGGLNLVEEQGNHFRFRHFFSTSNQNRIRCLLHDRQGNLWVGSYNGLICFQPEQLFQSPEAYRIFRFDIHNPHSISCNDIKTLFEDQQGRLWIGTAGGGLNRYLPAEENSSATFVHFTTQQGLAGEVITGILETPDEKLWISSEGGLTRLDRKRESFMSFHFAEGSYGNHFNENSCCLRHNGETLWGTLDGMLIFHPARYRQNRFVPPIIFTDFYLYDEKAEVGAPYSPLKKSVSYSQRIDLTHQQNTFTLSFANLNLTEPERNRYTYILEPYDKQWSRAANINQVTYKNLEPGKYTFRVKGSNGDGRWNLQESRLTIVVHPPFWKSDVAYVVYLVLGLLAIYIALRLAYQFNTLNNTIKVEKQLTDYKLRFFTNISHEFRTPLTLIRGVVENLNEQRDLPASTRQQIHLLDRNANQMTRLIDQLLEFRKIQNNVLTLNLEKTDIIRFAKEIYTAFREMALQKHIHYHFSADTDNWEIYIDRGKVDKILFNLLSNAFKFTPSGGNIEVTVEKGKTPDTCLLSVKDTGIGIPKDKQHQLFSRFMQVHFSASGTGVGLSLVKEFTEVHKGKVWYEDNEGPGSIFRVELPASAAAYEGENFVSTPTTAAPTITTENVETEILALPADSSVLAAWKVLIIDDNEDIRDFLSGELCKHFQVETAENGRNGLEKAIAGNPDLIICDVMMPEMDGFEVTRRLKNEFQTCHIPIILLTAHSSAEHQLEGIQSGADAYITKPFSLKYLMSRVYKLIEQREKLKKRFSVSPSPEEKLLSQTDKDREFYELINRILDKHLSNPTFSVDEFSELAGLKRTLFYKKIKGLTGFSPNELIKIKRMKKAAELLANGKHTVAEVSWQVGIEDPFYFSKCFKAQFGCSPSKYSPEK